MKLQSKYKKLAAFTLMELIVGMVISLIVAATALMAYMLLFKQFEQYRLDSSKLEKIYEMGSLLREDIYRSQWMEKQGDALVLNYPSHQFQYIFNEEQIIRATPWRKDTFNIRPTSYIMQFAGEVLYSNAKADHLLLTYENDDIQLRSVYKKEYAADVLMKFERK